MKLRRRDTEVFSLSFLDVICCGFGAIILLLVLSEFGQPIVIERSRQDLESQIKRGVSIGWCASGRTLRRWPEISRAFAGSSMHRDRTRP
ncbi:MAG: hypothetical protein EBT81_05400 [Gammaproteobacteria bacterium]|nr:hypothetical protein [Gammaproteobacteria bacterium]